MKLDSSTWAGSISLLASAGTKRKTGSPLREADDPQAKWMQDMKSALQRLKAMPSAKDSAKEAATAKAAFIKRQLDSLKAMLLHASPEQAAAIARQVRGLAKELAALGHLLKTGGSSASTTLPSAGAAASADASSAEASPEAAPVAAEAGVSATAAEDSSEAGEDNQAAADPAAAEAKENKDANATDDDKELRAALLEARKVLKQIIALLKAKLAAADKETKGDVQAAEKSLNELNNTLAQGAGSDLYTALGSLGSGLADSSISVDVGGGSIDVKA
ncbi:hypothetical protein [Dechloromonas denitrificans]|uniref:hypothetical protein n=1 Tax=Dechloromonas denitrificans TaxID=281362 RepID=UPI001CF7EE0C|nr:hypothetical protein [Dechloromonas denitrificans]UCV04421.1 hypothetical protein KI611_03915 [Dechloromonas denitrificans]